MIEQIKILEKCFPDFVSDKNLELCYIGDVEREKIEEWKERAGEILKRFGVGYWEQLKEFQKEDVIIAALLMGENPRLILAHEMGLGKTIISATAAVLNAAVFRKKMNFLVIAPVRSGQFQNFADELRGWGIKRVVILERTLQLRQIAGKYTDNYSEPAFFIIAETRAKMAGRLRKLQPRWYAAAGKRAEGVKCPDCGEFVSAQKLWNVKPKCPACGGPLYYYEHNGSKQHWPLHRVLQQIPDIFSALIVDEAHEAKNRDSSRGTVAGAAAQMINTVFLLTGTPSQGKASNLFALLGMLYRWSAPFPYGYREKSRFLKDFGVFRKVVLLKDDWRGKISYRPDSNERVMETAGIGNRGRYMAMVLPAMIRRRKIDVGSELPQIKIENISIPLSEEHRSYYQQAREEALSYLEDRNYARYFWTLKEAANVPEFESPLELEGIPLTNKDIMLVKLLSELVKREKRKVIVFTELTGQIPVLRKIYKLCRKLGYRVELWDAGVQPQQRPALVRRFGEGSSQVAIASLGAYHVGINAVAASAVVFYDITYRPEVLTQARDRVWRFGQKRDVKIKFLILRDTIEASAWEVLREKIETIDAVIDGDMPPEEYTELLRRQAHSVLEKIVQLDSSRRGIIKAENKRIPEEILKAFRLKEASAEPPAERKEEVLKGEIKKAVQLTLF